MKKVDIAILGSGVAGLAASLRSKELGLKSVVFEKESSSGGLLDNFVIRGYRFDKAVHLSFAKEEKVRSIFDQTKFFTHPSDSFCFEENKWFKHPIQNNLFPLSPEEKISLIKSFLARNKKLSSKNDYKSWLVSQYGLEIAERYPLEYTKKYWQVEADRLSVTWIGDRMRRPDISEILMGAFTDKTPNHYYTKEMRYPVKGGYKAFIQPLINLSDIRLNHEVQSINTKDRALKFKNGKIIHYDCLVNTLPLPLIVDLLTTKPNKVTEASKNLVATSIDLISVGFNRNLVKDLWFYIYDKDILAARAHSPSVKSPNNAPKNCSSLQFEIYNYGNKSKYTDKELFENIRFALKKLKIATKKDIVFMQRNFIEYGNVIFLKGMEKHREIVRKFLNEKKIVSCGRFGEWDYLWSNQSFMSGYKAIDTLKNN